ncbi:hypothetical protein BVG80_09375 [Sphingobacteriales bacterium TSM_CSM]|nr:hypothetical protein BVG80_09375 [Sphingobacteriales bacterium TSM_CSM]
MDKPGYWIYLFICLLPGLIVVCFVAADGNQELMAKGEMLGTLGIIVFWIGVVINEKYFKNRND